MVTMHPDVAYMFIGAGGDNAQRLEETIHRGLYVRGDEDMHREQYRIVPGDMQEMDRQLQRMKPRQVVELLVIQHPLLDVSRPQLKPDSGTVKRQLAEECIG